MDVSNGACEIRGNKQVKLHQVQELHLSRRERLWILTNLYVWRCECLYLLFYERKVCVYVIMRRSENEKECMYMYVCACVFFAFACARCVATIEREKRGTRISRIVQTYHLRTDKPIHNECALYHTHVERNWKNDNIPGLGEGGGGITNVHRKK